MIQLNLIMNNREGKSVKKYTAPNIDINLFMMENIITTSGTDTETAEGKIRDVMQRSNKGYTSIESFRVVM